MKPSRSQERRIDLSARKLRSQGVPFAIATVVRTIDATSAKPGAKALVLADGTIAEGWVGGGCARGAIGRAAKAAIAAREAKFVSLRPAELLEAEGVEPGEEKAGARFARNGCPSKGSMDVFVEPVLPEPQLAICGDGPVARAIAGFAARLDMHRVMMAPQIGSAEEMEVEETQDAFAFDTDPGACRYVVVATQGRGDEAALRAALSSGATYVSFVGSRRKFEALRTQLIKDGVSAAALDQVKAPAGLDIAAITPDEIALSILSEITQRRRMAQREEGQNNAPDA